MLPTPVAPLGVINTPTSSFHTWPATATRWRFTVLLRMSWKRQLAFVAWAKRRPNSYASIVSISELRKRQAVVILRVIELAHLGV